MLSMLFKVGADATGAERAMAAAAKKGEAAFKSMGKEITGRLTGMFTAGAILDRIQGFTESIIENADALADMSDILGLSIEDIQRLQVAANQAGIPFKRLKGVLDAISAAQQQALTGDKGKIALFQSLGIDPSKASALDIMMKAVEAVDGTKAAAAAADLLGRRFNDVAATMRSLKALGPIEMITTEQANAIAKAKDDLDEAYRRLKVAGTPVVTGGLRFSSAMIESLQKAPFMALQKVTGLPAPLAEFLKRRFDASRQQGETTSTAPSPSTNAFGSLTNPPAAIPLAMQSDALSRIGLFVGGSGDMGSQLVTIGNYQLSELRAIRNNLEHANR